MSTKLFIDLFRHQYNGDFKFVAKVEYYVDFNASQVLGLCQKIHPENLEDLFFFKALSMIFLFIIWEGTQMLCYLNFHHIRPFLLIQSLFKPWYLLFATLTSSRTILSKFNFKFLLIICFKKSNVLSFVTRSNFNICNDHRHWLAINWRQVTFLATVVQLSLAWYQPDKKTLKLSNF